MKFDIWESFEAIVKIQVLVKSDKKSRKFVGIPMYIYDNISRNSSYKENRFRKKFVEKIKAHILCSEIFFFENRAF
jgi:hypothetical protein